MMYQIHNDLKQKLTETKARLDQLKRSKACVIPQDFFEYNAVTDVVQAKDETEFDKFVDKKVRATQDREIRKSELKNKMLEQVKQSERRKRGLSVSSVVSLAFSDASSRRRGRSDDSDGGVDAKHSKCSPELPPV